jgi:heme A synthase
MDVMMNDTATKSQRRFAQFAWTVLGANVIVVLWGAFVRATGSGAGCGSHWPLCNGEILPRAPEIETLIELSHRLTSGVALIMVVALAPWAWRAFPRGHRVRKAAMVSLLLMIVEALIGAGLVLLELVATNVSVARAYWMAGHLINTFLLLGALTLTAWWGSGQPGVRLRGQGGQLITLALALLGVLILGASGAITALGDTLVFQAGISPEDSPIVAALVDLRVYHPLLAFGVGGLLLLAGWTVWQTQPDGQTRRLALWLGGLYAVQLIAGAINVVLKAPVAMQLIHLLLSDLIWILLVLLAASALAERAPSTADAGRAAAPLAGQGLASG